MLAKLKTFSLLGIDALPVEVEVLPAGLPKTVLVGACYEKCKGTPTAWKRLRGG